MRHAYRRTPFQRETSVESTDAGVQVTQPNRVPTLIPYGDVTCVNLLFRPRRSAADTYVCRIESGGSPVLAISSSSWRNPFWLQNRSATYRPFVEDLHLRLSQRQPPPSFVAGDPPWYFALQISLWVLPILVIFLALHDADWPTRLMYTIGPIFPLGFVGIVYWHRRLRPNRPRPYDPQAIPLELLPSVKSTLP